MRNKEENSTMFHIKTHHETSSPSKKKRHNNLKMEEIVDLMDIDDEIIAVSTTDNTDVMNDSKLIQDDYQPIYFLRCHSKNNDSADVQTQIWQCLFEPDMDHPDKTTQTVATCGGNSICLINVQTGKVCMKYNHLDKREIFYALAWTTLLLDSTGTHRTNILAAGGKLAEVRLIHPAQSVCYHEFRVSHGIRRNMSINSLLFHPKMSNWLFCGSSDGKIFLWDIGIPNLPEYDVTPQQLLNLNAASEIYNLVFSAVHSCLIAGCEDGMQGWNLSIGSAQKKERPVHIKLELPIHPADEDKPVVDSLVLASEHVVGTKCALHGCIYLWDLKSTMAKCYKAWKGKKVAAATVPVKILCKLHWSDTDNYYMNIGCRGDQGLLGCGDDEGTLWIYNIRNILNNNTDSTSKYMLQPMNKLFWPKLEDKYLEISRKLPLDQYDIIIDSMDINSDGNYIVAVTNSNMVCIWKNC